MKDIVQDDTQNNVHQDLQKQADSTVEPKKRLETTKSGKLAIKIGTIFFAVAMILILLDYISNGDDPVAVIEPDSETPSVTSVTDVSYDTVSDEQKERLAQHMQGEKDSAEETGESFVDSNLFDVEGFSQPSVESVVKVEGEEADTKNSAQAETAQPQNEVKDNQTFENVLDDNNTNNLGQNKSSNGNGGKPLTEQKINRISQLVSLFNTEDKESSVKDMKSGNRLISESAPVKFSLDGSSPTTDENYANARSDSNENSPTESAKGSGRGLHVGDLLIGKVKNGLTSTSPSALLLVEVIQPEELKGGVFTFKPEVAYDNYVFQSNTFNYMGEPDLINAIVVTPNENLTTGYRSGVNYHEIYKWGMIFFTGIFGGAAEYVNALGGDVTVGDNTVIETNKFSPGKMLISSAGGVATAASDELTNAINKPPTVWIDAQDIVGIMVTEDFNPVWFPYIPKQQVDLLDSRRP